jgi:transposase
LKETRFLMLTWEDDLEIHALHKRGWSISAIARHTGKNRRTVRNYLNGVTTPGVRKPASADAFEPFVDYVSARLTEDPHLWARTLCDELEDLGYLMSYPTLTRQIRARNLRPACQDCAHAADRANAVINHPPGAETQWDWLDLPNPPTSWGWGAMAHLLVGSLAHSSRWRAVLAPAMTQPHLVDGLDRISRTLGGLTRTWRFDRMATVCDPGSGRVSASFAGVAKYYGVAVAICPARRGNRKGVVEKANHTAAQRWWRTLPDDITVEQAQQSLDEFCRVRADARRRATAAGKVTVATLAATEPLAPLPGSPYPLVLREDRTVSRQAMVSYRGNRYSVPPELASATVSVTHVLGSAVIASSPPRRSPLPAIGWPPMAPGSWSATTATSWHWINSRWPLPPSAADPIAARNASHPVRLPDRRRKHCASTHLTSTKQWTR